MNEEKMTFMLKDESGKETEFEVLFTFDSKETGKSYVAYTDNSKDEQGSTRVYASIYTPNQEPMKLEAIETEEEWAMIQNVLDKIGEATNGEEE